MSRKMFCTFESGNLAVGIEADRIQEIIRYQRITKVPRAEPAVSGLINLRGQIITAIDLATCLGVASSSGHFHVIVRGENEIVGLTVDTVGDVMELVDDAREHTPATVDEKVSKMTECVYKIDGKLLLILDLSAIVTLKGHTRRVAAGHI